MEAVLLKKLLLALKEFNQRKKIIKFICIFFQINVTIGQENANTQIFTQLDATHCHIMTEHLQRYTLIGEPALLGRAIKILRLAAFAPMSPPSMDYSIRVYVVEDTPDALEVGMRSMGESFLELFYYYYS